MALAVKGVSVSYAHQSKPFSGRQDVVVFHRPRGGLRFWRLANRLRRQGTTVLADFDDLIIHERYAHHSPGVLNGLVTLRRTQKQYRTHRLAIEQCDGVVVSTQSLAYEVSACFPGKPVVVINNAVHYSWRDANVSGAVAPEKVITYFPGTRSHDRDFALIKAPLESFLRAHPEVRLEITGPLEFSLVVHEGQVSHHERVPFALYPERIARGWVNLAPLENTPFNRCKSALKALEAGYFSVPTICSPNPDFVRFEQSGALVAPTPQSWIAQLERLLDEDEYQCVTDGLSARTLALADIKLQADALLGFVSVLREKK